MYKLAENLELPDEASKWTNAILAIKGAERVGLQRILLKNLLGIKFPS